MNIVHTRQEFLDDETEYGVTVVSHRSITEPGKTLVRIIASDGDIYLATTADTRGQALDLLADYFMRLSRVVRKAAWAPGSDDETTPEAR